MTALVDLPAIPWTFPAVRQLRSILSELYPDSEAALAVAEDVGLRPQTFSSQLTPDLLWRKILTKAAQQALLRDLVEYVLAENPRSVRGDFLKKLLSEEPEQIAVDARPSGPGSAFLAGNDNVTHPEALLFHDDLSIKIGRLPWLVGALDRVAAHASGVCKIVASSALGTQNGTGFLVGPDLVMTNWHVVETGGNRAYRLRALFDFDDDGDDGLRPYKVVDGDVASIKGSAADDWAVFRLAGEPPPAAAIVRLTEAEPPSAGEAAFVIQHPGGETKRIAYTRNTVTSVTDRVIHYLSDTMAGSSGSPVFNAAGRIIALHHAGGQPQLVAGRLPIVKNEGIRIEPIVAQMREQGCEAA